MSGYKPKKLELNKRGYPATHFNISIETRLNTLTKNTSAQITYNLRQSTILMLLKKITQKITLTHCRFITINDRLNGLRQGHMRGIQYISIGNRFERRKITRHITRITRI